MYRLRELYKDDLPIINKWRNNPDVIDCLGAPFRFINPDVDEFWYQNYLANRANQVRCAVVSSKADEILALVSLVNIDFINQSAQFHILVGSPQNQGKGIGSFATNAMLHHAFYNMNLHRIELYVLEDNLRAQHLYKKVGFVKEGLIRQAKFKNGQFVNLYLYSLLRKEYDLKSLVGGV